MAMTVSATESSLMERNQESELASSSAAVSSSQSPRPHKTGRALAQSYHILKRSRSNASDYLTREG